MRGSVLHDLRGPVYPVLFELDRGMEFKQAFKAHVRVRIEMITSGLYERVFAQRAVKIAYVTLGESERTRTSRRTSMCAWAREVLKECGIPSWASVFHFADLAPGEMYQQQDLFTAHCWHQPGSEAPVTLLPPL